MACWPTGRELTLLNVHVGGVTAPPPDPAARSSVISDVAEQTEPSLTAISTARHRLVRAVRRSVRVAIGIVEGNGGDFAAAPNDQSANGRKDQANDEKRRQDRLGREDRLPCLEPLLLERGV